MNQIQYLILLLQEYGLSSTSITNFLTIIYNNIGKDLEQVFQVDNRYLDIYCQFSSFIDTLTITDIKEWYNGSGSLTTISDNFNSYTDGNLGSQGNWLAVINNITIIDISGDKQITSATSSPCLVKRSESFNGDHSSQITLKALFNSVYIGVAVRLSGSGATSSGYYYYADGSNRKLKYINAANPSGVNIATCVAVVSANDTLKLVVQGSTLKCYYNGTLDTSLTGGTGTFTDTTISSGGTPGISGYGSGATYGDLWIGENL